MLSPGTPDLSYRRLATKGRLLPKESAWPLRRIAILSDAAVQQFVPVLRALFYENEVNVEIFEGNFDAIELEVFDKDSKLYRFQPDTILLAVCTQALRTRYFHHANGDFVRPSTARIEQLWATLRAHTTAQIIQFNYAMPYERLFGNYDVQVPQSLYAVTMALNGRIADAAVRSANVAICDVDAISSNVGRSQWFDDRLWNMSKTFCKLDHLPLVCQSVVEIVTTLMGRLTKCLVLDLDNTLWGGTIGDRGHLGIDIGAHGDGEAFFHFQNYLLSLKKRGIILSVCSKNEMVNALRPFTDNPDMVLRRDDIAVFIANWGNKADNIRRIRDRLNIGLDSMVFLDDNPFERNLVRQLVPDVVVPELPEDPADYVRFLSALNLFETTSFSSADTRRAEQYKEEADRLELRESASDIGEYLQSLDMQIQMARFDPDNLARISQLMQRSNQFNLTTRRLNEEACRQMMLDFRNYVPLYAKLADRFGDHGLISVVIVRIAEDALEITDWLMSCRVLSRGVEECLMNHLVCTARQKRVSTIYAEYIPTAKNGMVKDFFGRFGFEKLSDENGRTRWAIDIGNYQSFTTFIRESRTAWTSQSLNRD
jgi:FkbH-like protein